VSLLVNLLDYQQSKRCVWDAKLVPEEEIPLEEDIVIASSCLDILENGTKLRIFSKLSGEFLEPNNSVLHC
jgi:hypothetical protein